MRSDFEVFVDGGAGAEEGGLAAAAGALLSSSLSESDPPPIRMSSMFPAILRAIVEQL